MYSPWYFYFNVRFDAQLSQSVTVDRVKGCLAEIKELEEANRVQYKNTEPFPWIDLTLLHARSYNSWAMHDLITECNLIAVVGSKLTAPGTETMETRHAQYVGVLKKIADVLGWEVVEEETEDGIEDCVLYKPTPW